MPELNFVACTNGSSRSIFNTEPDATNPQPYRRTNVGGPGRALKNQAAKKLYSIFAEDGLYKATMAIVLLVRQRRAYRIATQGPQADL